MKNKNNFVKSLKFLNFKKNIFMKVLNNFLLQKRESKNSFYVFKYIIILNLSLFYLLFSSYLYSKTVLSFIINFKTNFLISIEKYILLIIILF